MFYKDGPSNSGFVGIWTWSAIPNQNDTSKDYIQSWYNADIDAIEIVTIAKATSLDDLVGLLKEGIEYKPHSRKIMYAFYASKGKYTGIL